MDRLIPLIRFNLILLAGIMVCYALYYGKQILILLAFSILFSMLMNPVANKLEEKGMKRVWSTVVCVLIIVLIVCMLMSLLFVQIKNVSEQMPQIQQKFDKYLSNLQVFIQHNFNVSPQQQIEMIKQQLGGMGQSITSFARTTLTGAVGLIGYFVMILVLMFLFLLQREKYKRFFIDIYKGHSRAESEEVVSRIINVSHSYLTGIMMSMIIIATLYSIGFLIIGIKNAVLLAAIAASLIIIPYIGAFIGGFFPFVMALVTENSFGPALGVVGVMAFVQTIDNNLIEPYVIGGQVRLSALASIVTLFMGGALWGIPGVILFLPMTGIIKILFDHNASLQPYAYLIGDQQKNPPSSQLKNWIKARLKKK